MVATALDDNAGIFGVREPSRTLTRRVQPIRAARAIRRLVADKDDTEQVFEIMNALAGRSVDWGYAKLMSTSEGGLQAYRRQELADRLQDRARPSRAATAPRSANWSASRTAPTVRN